MSQIQPIRIDATDKKAKHPATFIFLHGFSDEAESWIDVAKQFQSANKLSHLTWIFPNAPHNHEAMTTAWYTPTSFSPIPMGRSSSGEDSAQNQDSGDDFEEEAEAEILDSVEYVCKLVTSELQEGTPLSRIVVGGFSQGCAISLVVGLASRLKGQLAGIVGLSGYLPRSKKIREGRQEYTKTAERGDGEGARGMQCFLAHGTKDMLVPMRVFRDTKARVARTMGEEVCEWREYQGMGHVASGAEFRDMCAFLERVVPA